MTVHLVGAGPGDPGLLTVRAAELLRRADVVVHDRLVSAAILDVAGQAELIDVGKTPGGKTVQQERINQLLVDLGQTGREVVRLKGGDPFVFGRGGEEAIALRTAGVPYSVVPGVTAAIAAPAAIGVPVTHRHIARSVAIVTGREDPHGPAGVDWGRLAGAVDTIVILMGASRIASIAEALLAGGLDPDTPLAAVTEAGWPDQSEVRTTLGQAGSLDVGVATTIIVGAVAATDVRPGMPSHLQSGGQTVEPGVAGDGDAHGARHPETGAIPDEDAVAGEALP